MDHYRIDHGASPWNEQLPGLLTLLDGLARHAANDTNESCLAFLGYLHDIEKRIARSSREYDAFLVQSKDTLEATERLLSDASAFLSDRTGSEGASFASMGGDRHAASPKMPDAERKTSAGDTLDVSDIRDEITSLIKVMGDRKRAVLSAQSDLDALIRKGLAAAQVGDVIRQQVELVANALVKLKDAAENSHDGSELSSRLMELMTEISQSYVMKTQYDVHRNVFGEAAHGDLQADEELPRFVLF